VEAVAENESEAERIDRELIELLNEVRVVLPGAQVLFAFLLTLPFMSTFDSISREERAVYFVAFMSAAAGIALLMSPSAYHRIRFRSGDKLHMLIIANRLIIAGTVLLAVGMIGAVYVVSGLLFGASVAIAIAAAIGAWFIWFWYGLPLLHRATRGGNDAGNASGEKTTSERAERR
jgi:hypothetical protein